MSRKCKILGNTGGRVANGKFVSFEVCKPELSVVYSEQPQEDKPQPERLQHISVQQQHVVDPPPSWVVLEANTRFAGRSCRIARTAREMQSSSGGLRR